MHSAPNLGLACTHTVSCRKLGLAVSWPSPAVSWPCVAARQHALLRAVSSTVLSCRALCRAPLAQYHGAHCAVSRLSSDITQQSSRALYRDPQGRPPATIQLCIATSATNQAARERALSHALARGTAMSWPLLAVSQGRVPALPRHVVACH